MGAQATFEYLVKVRDQSSKNLAAIKGKMLAVTAAATAIAAGIAKAADAFLGFEGALNEFKAVSGATAGQMERVSALAKEMGSTTKFSATESAEALTFLGRAGLTVEETMTALPGMLNLAAAGNLDLASAADIATNVMSGMGLGVDNLEGVVDVLSKTAASSNTNIEQLGTAMSYVAPIANSAGLSIEDTAAAVGILSDAGIQGTKAGTGLRGVIGSLVSPSKAASNVLADLGVSTLDSAGKMLPLDDIVQQLAESGAGTTEIMQIFGREAGPSMSVLLEKGAEGLRGFSGELQNADGHAKDTADTMQEGLTGAVTRMYSAMDTLWVVVGEKVAPVLTILADTVATAASEVTKLIEGSYSLAEILRFLSGGMIRYGDATDEARLAVAKHETEMQKGMAAAAAFQAEQKRLREATDDVAASMKAAKRSADDLAKALKDLQDREAALASATPGKMAIFQNSVVNAMSNSKAAVRAVLSPEVMAEWEGNLADMGDGPKNILGPRFRAGFHEAVVEPIPPLMEEAGKDASNAFAENFFSDLASSFRSGGTFMGSLKASVMDGMGNLFKEGGALQFIGDKWGEAMEFLGGIPVVGPFLKAFGPALMKGIAHSQARCGAASSGCLVARIRRNSNAATSIRRSRNRRGVASRTTSGTRQRLRQPYLAACQRRWRVRRPRSRRLPKLLARDGKLARGSTTSSTWPSSTATRNTWPKPLPCMRVGCSRRVCLRCRRPIP